MLQTSDSWILPEWPAPPCVHALTTTRISGFSSGPYASLNLAGHVGDDPESVDRNRRLIVEMVGLPSEPVWLNQVHGNECVALPSSGVLSADAACTTQPDTVCAVLTADCLPVLFCSRDGSRVAAAHAGWRGLLSGVLENTLAAMECNPGEVQAWLGPAIGPRQFEVGDDVRDGFLSIRQDHANAFQPRGGKWLADIYQLARQRLAVAGVLDVFGGDECTVIDAHRFHSFRRDGVSGRMASLIWIGQP